MIKYKLICKSCEFSFDSWFASSKEYEKLNKKKLLNCYNCDSKKVEKSLMAPRLVNKKENKIPVNKLIRFKQINKKIKEYQKFIQKNFKYVGENFAYEARSIHYDKKKKTKGIYGTASKDEIKELKEEGINTEMIPWLNDRSN